MSDAIVWLIIAALLGAAGMGAFGATIQFTVIGLVVLSIFALAMSG